MPQSIRAGSGTRAAIFAPLDGAGRAELVLQRLTDAIVLGVLHDGERLPSEAELARQLGVATVTAREALEILRRNKLVHTKRGRDGGSFVTFAGRGATDLQDERLVAWSRVQVRDLGVHYSAIAGLAAELAADRASAADIENLERILDRADAGTADAARRGQGTFRLEVAALSQSARLVREELRLQAEFGSLLWLSLRDASRRERCQAVQRATVAALIAEDGARARQLTVTQIIESIEWLIEAKSLLELKGRSTMTDSTATVSTTAVLPTGAPA
ncbi:DNA-binding transcriptional regulator, FadR family [Cryobacterium flavum]|uniref:DNA-binding transcriptional regulator, FadR family n=1 Tax=Cryobacterium flavum TaxID=1424659 RepID=A0A4R8VF45_9MICO|nr:MULTISPECIES: GntR family transcriptional regulator [Cryobacterium]TFB82163.1 FadR family transcriptional regulator [Cryobacterium flavum]SDN89888.1 DNA-binding transcriptional regulator, FadR family [Cryobacterium flavum]